MYHNDQPDRSLALARYYYYPRKKNNSGDHGENMRTG